MGFFSKIFKTGKAYPGKLEPGYACEMEIGGQKYLLTEFDLDFSTVGGNRHVPLYAVFAGKLSPGLESWITRDSQRKDGVVKFFRNDHTMAESAVFTLSFSGASCKRYRQTMGKDNPVTTLVLTARQVRLEEEEFVMD